MEHSELLLLYKNMITLRRIAFAYGINPNNFVDMDTVYVSSLDGTYDIKIGEGSIIAPYVCFYGKVVIGKDTFIGPFIELYNVSIGDRCEIGRPQIIDTNIGDDARIGKFAEMKNVKKIGKNFHALHSSYLGDVEEIGDDVNIAANTVTANFDGTPIKNKTIIGNRVETGINSSLVSRKDKTKKNEPGLLIIGDDVTIGANAIITKDVPPGVTVIGLNKILEKKD
ncbi:MAG: hypothetical protein HY445_01080 [Candidatus Niyogibacteria bacterium]|nr:hypothetical protein [Candidatus Niyogibacteria bacterium]